MDGTLQIFFLSANEIRFLQETRDPWYHATTPTPRLRFENQFYQDEPASPLACACREQVCNPNLGGRDQCTKLGSLEDLGNISSSQPSMQRLNWTMRAIRDVANEAIPAGVSSRSLLARKSMALGAQAPISDNQWQLEMEYWFEISMATMQQSLVSLALSEPKHLAKIMVPPSNEEEIKLCRSMVSNLS